MMAGVYSSTCDRQTLHVAFTLAYCFTAPHDTPVQRFRLELSCSSTKRSATEPLEPDDTILAEQVYDNHDGAQHNQKLPAQISAGVLREPALQLQPWPRHDPIVRVDWVTGATVRTCACNVLSEQ